MLNQCTITTNNELLYIKIILTSLDDAVEEEDDEQETDNILSQVFDEIGINVNQAMSDIPVGKVGVGSETVEKDDLQARLDSLRKE